MIGRFPLYTDRFFNSDEEKWQYVIEIIERADKAASEFILNSPDGTLRVVGPFQTKRGNCLVISCPLPALFRFLVMNLPAVVNCVIKPRRAFVELTTSKELFEKPTTYILKVKNAHYISFKRLIEDFYNFLGIRIKPEYFLRSIKIDGLYTYITVTTLNKDASALMNFSRYAGFGINRKYGHGDVEVFQIEDQQGW